MAENTDLWQIEAGREKVGKKGVVRDPKVHEEVISRIVRHADEVSFEVLDLSYSPIRGPEGNIEFLGHLTLSDQPENCPDPAEVVRQAHETLDKGADV